MGYDNPYFSFDNLVYLKDLRMVHMKFERIFYWLLIIFALYLAVEIIRKILGGSLGFEELMIGLLVANLGFSFRLHSKLSELHSKISEHLGCHKGKQELY